MKKIEKITNLNILLTMLIVLLHSSYAWMLQDFAVNSISIGIQSGIMEFINVICGCTVGFFFAISAYLYYYSYTGIQSYFSKLKKRCKTVLVPFIIWNALALIYYETIVNFTNIFDNKQVPDTLGKIILYIINSEGDPPLWYLLVLMQFVVLGGVFIISW